MSYKSVFLFVFLGFTSSYSMAGVFAQGGLHFGGDTLATVQFLSGPDESIEAGGLLSASLGYELDVSDILLFKASAGFKTDTIIASDIDADFTRFPLTGMVFLKAENFHIGAGVTQHTNVELSVDGFSGSATAKFDDATGIIFEVDYLLNKHGYLGIKFTSIDYQLPGSSVDVDGSSIGVVLGLRFGK